MNHFDNLQTQIDALAKRVEELEARNAALAQALINVAESDPIPPTLWDRIVSWFK